MKEKTPYIVVLFLLFLFVLYLLIQRIRCTKAQKQSRKRLSSYRHKSLSLSYGDMTYVDEGKGEVKYYLSMEYSEDSTRLLTLVRAFLTTIEYWLHPVSDIYQVI